MCFPGGSSIGAPASRMAHPSSPPSHYHGAQSQPPPPNSLGLVWGRKMWLQKKTEQKKEKERMELTRVVGYLHVTSGLFHFRSQPPACAFVCSSSLFHLPPYDRQDGRLDRGCRPLLRWMHGQQHRRQHAKGACMISFVILTRCSCHHASMRCSRLHCTFSSDVFLQFGHNKVKQHALANPSAEPLSVYKQPMWLIGIICVIGGSLCDVFSFGFADMSLLAPLGAVRCCVNITRGGSCATGKARRTRKDASRSRASSISMHLLLCYLHDPCR